MKNKADKRAFTITESLVAVVILSISVTAISVSLRSSARANTISIQKIRAMYIAQELLDQQMFSGENSFKTTNKKVGIYSCSTEILPFDHDNIAQLKITVKWNSGGTQQQIVLASLKSFYLEQVQL